MKALNIFNIYESLTTLADKDLDLNTACDIAKDIQNLSIPKQILEQKRNKLYCYSKPNTMDGYLQNSDCHRYTDDVALCYADNIEQAIDIFSRLYDKSLLENNVREVEFNNYSIFIATDY